MTFAKILFETQMIKSFDCNNPSSIYKYINKISGSNSIPTSVNYESSTATSNTEKASLFNTFFHSVFCHSSYILPSLSDIPVPSNTCSDIVINEEEVFSILSTLNTSKAAGHDKIGPNILRHCALALYSILHHLYSLCLNQSYRLALLLNHSHFKVR